MYSSYNTSEVLDRGMKCLLEKLGTVETERFISTLIRERFDYTKWRRGYFGNATVSEINDAATEYDSSHPFNPKKTQLPI